MIDLSEFRKNIVFGLRNHLMIPVVRSNQTSTPPKYPYCSYTITSISNENKGTWGEYEDGIQRQPLIQKWSFTILSDDVDEALSYALRAREYFDNIGRRYLRTKKIVVYSVGNINNRDNLITIEYEYRHGFDVEFYTMSELPINNEYTDDVVLELVDKNEINGG